MGTIVEITVASRSEAMAKAAITAAFDEIERADALLGPGDDSLVSKLNRADHRSNVPVGKEMFGIFTEAVEISEASSGSFDISIGAVSRLWRLDAGGKRPIEEEIASEMSKVGYRNIILREEESSVGLSIHGMVIDLGAIAKGWAVDRACAILRERGIASAIVDAGGDLRLIGSAPGKAFWRIGIQHPRVPAELLATLDLADTAVVTSGDYERFFMEDGVRYHHILDPATGRPARGCQSVTVIAGTAMEADACATAAFVLGPEKGIAFLRGRPGVRGLIVDADGALHGTDEELAESARR